MEPLRPQVDNLLLSWASGEKWRRSDFVVDKRGIARLHPELARVVVQRSGILPTSIENVIEWYPARLKVGASRVMSTLPSAS